MNLTDYTFLLNKPEAINERYAETLENVLDEFPYFQSARVLRLKHLYNQDSYKYNYALKVAAAYTTDRSMLFDFITSDDFVAVQKGLYEKKLEELEVKIRIAALLSGSPVELLEIRNRDLLKQKLEGLIAQEKELAKHKNELYKATQERNAFEAELERRFAP